MFLGRFAAKTILVPWGPPHFSINAFMSNACNFSINILYLYAKYCGFLQHTGFDFPVLMENSYPRIVCFAPSLQKQSQYLFTIGIKCSLTIGVTLLFNLMCLCRSLPFISSLNIIKYVGLIYYQVCFGMYTAFLYSLKSNAPSST